jgi:hypothetical protein
MAPPEARRPTQRIRMPRPARTRSVALTVNDGVESDTLTRPAYVNVGYRVYLPTVTRKYDPFLYDDFNNPAYDGSYNYALWSFR